MAKKEEYKLIIRRLEAVLEKTPANDSEAVAARAHLRNALKEVNEALAHYACHLCVRQRRG